MRMSDQEAELARQYYIADECPWWHIFCGNDTEKIDWWWWPF